MGYSCLFYQVTYQGSSEPQQTSPTGTFLTELKTNANGYAFTKQLSLVRLGDVNDDDDDNNILNDYKTGRCAFFRII